MTVPVVSHSVSCSVGSADWDSSVVESFVSELCQCHVSSLIQSNVPSAPSCLLRGFPDFLLPLDVALRCCFCCSFSSFSSFFCSLMAFLASALEGVRSSSLGVSGTNAGASGFSFEPLNKLDLHHKGLIDDHFYHFTLQTNFTSTLWICTIWA